jgi:6-phosphogluconolactonase
VANPVEKFYTDRLTLTLPVLNRARTIVFLVSGQEKAGILQQVLDGPDGKFPSQLIQPDDGELLWLVDEAAASQLAGSK